MGRLLHPVDYADDGTTIDYDRAIQLDGKGRIWKETIDQRHGGTRTVNTYAYTGTFDTDYALGQVLGIDTRTTVTGRSGETISSVNYGYAFFDGPQQQSITRTENGAQSITTYSFSGTGTLAVVSTISARNAFLHEAGAPSAFRSLTSSAHPAVPSHHDDGAGRAGALAASTLTRARAYRCDFCDVRVA